MKHLCTFVYYVYLGDKDLTIPIYRYKKKPSYQIQCVSLNYLCVSHLYDIIFDVINNNISVRLLANSDYYGEYVQRKHYGTEFIVNELCIVRILYGSFLFCFGPEKR